MTRRYFRQFAPGHLVHIISRCLNGEFRLTSDADRLEYLDRLAHAQHRTDWQVAAYALMSNHVHLLAFAGEAPSAALIQPLHTGFARALNRRQGRLGPVFAGRHATHVVAPALAARTVAYLHNNVVRAGLVADAAGAEPTWSSHRAYIGEAQIPPWLAVERMLVALGLTYSRAGQAAFAALVAEHAAAPRDHWLADPAEIRRDLREAAGAPVEVSWPWQRRDREPVVDVYAASVVCRPRWRGDVTEVLAAVSAYTGVPAAALLSRGKQAAVVGARRIAVLLWVRVLGRPQNQIAGALGICDAAASRHLRQAEGDVQVWSEASTLAAVICHDNSSAKPQ
jgi:putative transposase